MSNLTGKKARANGEGGIVHVPGSQNWYMIYRVDGKQHKVTTETTDEAAALRILKDKLETLHVDDRRGIAPIENFKNVKYEDIRDLYEKHFRAKGSVLIRRADQTEYVRGVPQLDEFFTGRLVKNITSEVILDYIETRSEDVEDPAIRRELVTLRAMFHQAQKTRRISHDMIPHFTMPQDSESAATYITPQDYAKIEKHLPDNLKPFFKFLYSTACRLGAAKSITWQMVNADCTEINIPGSLMKNRKQLKIALAGKQLEPIAALLRTMVRTDKPVFDSTNYRTEWSRAVAKAGFGTFDKKTRERTGHRIHDCRGSAAVNMLEAGIAQDTVMKIGGWRSAKAFSVYNDLTPSRLKAAQEKTGDYVAVEMKG